MYTNINSVDSNQMAKETSDIGVYMHTLLFLEMFDNLVVGQICSAVCSVSSVYHNDPKFSDKKVLANSADPHQILGAVWSGSSLFAI